MDPWILARTRSQTTANLARSGCAQGIVRFLCAHNDGQGNNPKWSVAVLLKPPEQSELFLFGRYDLFDHFGGILSCLQGAIMHVGS